ncbi:MAG: tol-pal system protein YbgF [Thermodesulfovibrionales bacterium]|nr:tol-pal system protein YbgF [Thermodesulfovibrionales bacterium]
MFLKRIASPVHLNMVFHVFLLAAAVTMLSACVTTDEMEVFRQDIGRLQRDSSAMQNELNGMKEKTAGVAKEESFNVMRQSQSEIQTMLSNASRDIQVLSGRFDENKYFVENKLKESSTEMELLKAQLTALEGQIKELKTRMDTVESQVKENKAALKERSGENAEDAEAIPGQAAPGTDKNAKTQYADKKAHYDAAYALFINGKYSQAREKFELFLKTYPQNELSDNAQFWIGETYYREKDFESAILSFETLLKKFPKSPKVPSSLLKQGLSFVEIGDPKTAKVILDQVVERFPDTSEAKIAKKKTDEISARQNLKKKK